MTRSWLICDAPDLPLSAFQRGLGKKRPNTLEGGGGGQPQAPDPWSTAQATTQANTQTAAFNKALNLNNFSNPFGSQNSYVAGVDSTGAPIYQTNITANPQLQAQMNGLFGQVGQSGAINQHALSGLNHIVDQAGWINDQLVGLNGTLSPNAAQNAQQQGQDAAYKSQTQYLDPQFAQQGVSLASQLANQGLTPGSEAYNNAMLNFNNQKQQAYSNAQNQSILTGSQIGTQNWQNQLAGVSAQSGLFGQMGQNLQSQAGLYGQQVGIGQTPYSNLQSIASMIPGYSGPGQAGAQPADIGGYMNNAYQGQVANANANTASRNSMISAGAGLGSAALMAGAMMF